MQHWIKNSNFYHIYPLGLCGAPPTNNFASPPVNRIDRLYPWADHIRDLGFNALYLGPLFESSTHGYDTADYFQVDRRLGTNQALAALLSHFQQKKIRVIFDGVFNHVGRDFWAFRDLQQNQSASPFVGWFQELQFGKTNPAGDPFSYATWQGHCHLVKLNLQNPDVKNHLFEAVSSWIRDYDIDGLRLDAADCMDLAFLRELSTHCRSIKPDFWLLGEIIHGDYRKWANPDCLDSVTNYEIYKGLYSSFNEKNFFEIAYSLNRQFGESGLYRKLDLYNFADNHDVNRIASSLKNSAQLYPLYGLLFTLPGVPAVYYGSEWGITGLRIPGTDAPLRPEITLPSIPANALQPDLTQTIRRLAEIRLHAPALQSGQYRQLLVASEQFGFLRSSNEEKIIVLMNSADKPVTVELKIPEFSGKTAVDLLNPGWRLEIKPTKNNVALDPCWIRILLVE